LAITSADKHTFAKATAILESTEKSDLNLAGWVEQDTAFHCTLYEAAKRPRLLTLIKHLRLLTSRYVLMHAAVKDYRIEGHKEHRAFLNAFRKRDLEAADRLLRTHISGVAELFQAYAYLGPRDSNW
jgi:DNA-binding GntR family transcriptional regulator